MGRKKPEWLKENLRKISAFCKAEGYEYQVMNMYHIRIIGATHIIDLWPSRMKGHRIDGEVVNAREEYFQLTPQFDKNEFRKLVEEGKYE